MRGQIVFSVMFGAVLLAAAPAAAQSAQQALQLTEEQYRHRFEAEEESRPGPSWLDLIEQYGLGPVNLSVRVDALIQIGRCREAREMALAAGNRHMALRARQLCPGDTGVVTARGRRILSGEQPVEQFAE